MSSNGLSATDLVTLVIFLWGILWASARAGKDSRQSDPSMERWR
jgi:hypothetical protein